MMASCAPMPRASDLALLGAARLRAQRVTGDSARSPTDVVTALGAVQAQDYSGSLWAIGLRVPGATAAAIERAADERLIVRTWPMRGTLHFVAAVDARWMRNVDAPHAARRARRNADALRAAAEGEARCAETRGRSIRRLRQSRGGRRNRRHSQFGEMATRAAGDMDVQPPAVHTEVRVLTRKSGSYYLCAGAWSQVIEA